MPPSPIPHAWFPVCPRSPACFRTSLHYPLTALIVDGDALTAERMATHLRQLGVGLVARADTREAAIDALERGNYDVACLAAKLGNGADFELVRFVRTGAAVIIVSGGESHAARAFDVGAADYLVKPVTRERLSRALRRIAHGEGGPGRADRLMLRVSAAEVRFVSVLDVIAVFSSENYCEVVTADRRWLMRCTMAAWESQLPAEMFVRVHRTAIVNVTAVDALERRAGKGWVVCVRGLREPVRVSRSLELRLRVAVLTRR